MASRVAVVTGGNRGIGLGLVRALCKSFEGDVILTSRDCGKGMAAVGKLKEEGLNPRFYELDVNNRDTIFKLRDYLQETYGGLDLLVNNAAVALSLFVTTDLSYDEEVKKTINTNYFGVLHVSEILFPLLRPHARVCNVSSRALVKAFWVCSPEVKAKFVNPNITVEELNELMTSYVQAAKDDTMETSGFPRASYGFSKIGVTVLTRIQQKTLDKEGKDDIIFNSCSPGFVNTDMTAGKGPLTVEEGTVTPLYLCFLPQNTTTPRGHLVYKKEICDWENITSL